jgi:hypothetical protein
LAFAAVAFLPPLFEGDHLPPGTADEAMTATLKQQQLEEPDIRLRRAGMSPVQRRSRSRLIAEAARHAMAKSSMTRWSFTLPMERRKNPENGGMRRLSQNKGDQEYAASQHVALLAPIVAVYPKPEEHGSQGHNSQQEKEDHCCEALVLRSNRLLT